MQNASHKNLSFVLPFQQVIKSTSDKIKNMNKPLKNIRRDIKNHPVLSLLIASFLTILIGTTFYHYVEALRWIDALYFSFITITTVGYGDFTPQTDIGKLFTIVYILNGIGIIFGFINTIYGKRISRYKKSEERDLEKK